MIDLYFWTTPNGYKPLILLLELGLEYRLKPIDIAKGEQFAPEFLAISPNNRIPALVDHTPKDGDQPIRLFESGAILEYLADKTGSFLPQETRERYQVLQWLYWQMGGLGPMAGQNHHFSQYAPQKIDYAIKRYVGETGRLYGVLNKHLVGREWIGGAYSIADIAAWPWIRSHKKQGQNLEDFPALKAWFERIAERPATVEAYKIGASITASQDMTDPQVFEKLFQQDTSTVKP